jgi:hypothetical protein
MVPRGECLRRMLINIEEKEGELHTLSQYNRYTLFFSHLTTGTNAFLSARMALLVCSFADSALVP